MQSIVKTLKDLEWDRLKEHIARRAAGEPVAARCRELPFLSAEQIPLHLMLVREFARCFDDGDPPPSLPVADVDMWLGHIAGEGVVPPQGLTEIASNLKLYVALARFLDNRRDVCPENARAVIPGDDSVNAFGLARLAAEIESAFEPDGSIRDTASPALGSLRRKVLSLREHLVETLDRIALREEDILRERTYTLRNERFVLPVRADAHRRLPGIVHGASGSGATIFVEPEYTIELGNELMLAREAVIREEKRILKELCNAVRDQISEIRRAQKALLAGAVRVACGRLSHDLTAEIPQPNAPGHVSLVRVRHPLLVLDGVKVVPINIEGKPGMSLVVSGPNAGGKTVSLKTVGLCSLMLAAGLPIPATADSRMGVFDAVLSDIGDEQSLERSLSTFSGHMANISSILETAGPNTLVLLDELAAGTDPAEGAALAEAILAALNQKGATNFATTHFDALKAEASSRGDFLNAAVGFDTLRMVPTFELRIGTPGSSSALSVAARYGIGTEILEHAKRLLPEGVRELALVVERLERERTEAAREREALAEQRRKFERAEESLRRELAVLKQKQTKFVDEETQKLWEAIRKAREEVRRAELSLKRRKEARTISAARETVEETVSKLKIGGALDSRSEDDLPGRKTRIEELRPGARVFVVPFGKSGVVDSLDKADELFVRIGPLKTRVGAGDLRLLEAASKPSASKGRPVRHLPTPAESGSEQTSLALQTGDNTIDLRGMRADEAQDAVDKFLDRALSNSIANVFIIHGHGTGALRSAVREYLSSSGYVSKFRSALPEEGGDGVTIAWLEN